MSLERKKVHCNEACPGNTYLYLSSYEIKKYVILILFNILPPTLLFNITRDKWEKIGLYVLNCYVIVKKSTFHHLIAYSKLLNMDKRNAKGISLALHIQDVKEWIKSQRKSHEICSVAWGFKIPTQEILCKNAEILCALVEMLFKKSTFFHET